MSTTEDKPVTLRAIGQRQEEEKKDSSLVERTEREVKLGGCKSPMFFSKISCFFFIEVVL
jgi:hypothetical protein